MNYICLFIFYMVWLAFSAYIIRKGLQAIYQRQIIYRWWTPLGTMIVTMRGDGVLVIGGCQFMVGGLLGAVMVANILQWNEASTLLSQLFLLSILVYGGVILLMKRWLQVESRHVWR
jgi:hypothetical protein